MKKITIAILISLIFTANVLAAGSSTQSPAVSKDVKLYNKGVTLMLEKKFAKAEKQFRKSLRVNDQFAEAHNNLAYISLFNKSVGRQSSDQAEGYDPKANLTSLHAHYPKSCVYLSMLNFSQPWSQVLPRLPH